MLARRLSAARLPRAGDRQTAQDQGDDNGLTTWSGDNRPLVSTGSWLREAVNITIVIQPSRSAGQVITE